MASWAGVESLRRLFSLLVVFRRRLGFIELLWLQFLRLAYLDHGEVAREFVLRLTLVNYFGLALHSTWAEMSRIRTWRSRATSNSKGSLWCVLFFQLVIAYAVQSRKVLDSLGHFVELSV